MQFQWLGLCEFDLIYSAQRASLNWEDQTEEVWGVEHPLVVTLGRRANSIDELVPSSNIGPVIVTDRGGLATIHSPGQLLIYPLLSLRRRGWGAREYVCRLLKITQETLQTLKIDSQIDEASSGLFVNKNKICFIGLRVSGGRVYHGLSLNVHNDLHVFHQIRACGVSHRPLTSLYQLGQTKWTCQDIFTLWTKMAQKSEGFVAVI